MPRRVGLFDNCMDFPEAAEMIPCTESSLRCYHNTWGVPSVRIAGRIWFLQPEVEAWVRNRAVEHRKNDGMAEAMWARQQQFAGGQK